MMAADRTPNELAAKLERSQNAYTTMMSDGHNSIIVRSKDDELAECYRLMAEAAVLLRRQGEQLDTLRAERDRLLEAIGNPADLRRWCDRGPGVAIGVLRRIAAAVPQDPEEGATDE